MAEHSQNCSWAALQLLLRAAPMCARPQQQGTNNTHTRTALHGPAAASTMYAAAPGPPVRAGGQAHCNIHRPTSPSNVCVRCTRPVAPCLCIRAGAAPPPPFALGCPPHNQKRRNNKPGRGRAALLMKMACPCPLVVAPGSSRRWQLLLIAGRSTGPAARVAAAATAPRRQAAAAAAAQCCWRSCCLHYCRRPRSCAALMWAPCAAPPAAEQGRAGSMRCNANDGTGSVGNIQAMQCPALTGTASPAAAAAAPPPPPPPPTRVRATDRRTYKRAHAHAPGSRRRWRGPSCQAAG